MLLLGEDDGAAAPNNPAPLAGSSLAACRNAARDIAFQHAHTLGRIQQIQNFGAHVVHRRKATPGRFTLTTFLGTLQDTTSAQRLIRILQPSILGLWLRATHAGVSPACLQTISSPHVHAIVNTRVAILRLCDSAARPRYVVSPGKSLADRIPHGNREAF